MTQQEYAALAIKATAKKNTFAEVVTQSGANAVNIEGHTGVLTTLLVNEPPIPGIYTEANAPATPGGCIRLSANGIVAFMKYEYSLDATNQTTAKGYSIPDGFAVPTLAYIQCLIDNNVSLSIGLGDSGNWQYWTFESLNLGMQPLEQNMLQVNPIELAVPVRLDLARLRLIYIG